MTRSLRIAAWTALVCLLFSGCGQKAPLFLPKGEAPPAEAKAKKPKEKPQPKASPSPSPSPEPEEPSPDEDDAQDGYSPMSSEPTF